MVRVKRHRQVVYVGLLALILGTLACGSLPAHAAETEDPGETGTAAAQDDMSVGAGLRVVGLALAAAIAMAAAALATARVQAAVGAGGTGAMAEKPEVWTYVLVLFAVPETLVVFGFVIAILLITKI